MLNRWTWIVGASLLIIAWVILKILAPHLQNISAQENAAPEPIALVTPEQAPPEIRPLVMRGFQILFETKKNLPEYAGDRISCTNCHFSAGNSLGGEQEGFSLVGVTNIYPKTLPGNVLYTLQERINSCFLKSTNGKALPVDSEPMKAIIAYLEWISSPAAGIQNPPWLGVKPLKSSHHPNAQAGERVYEAKCALCHGLDGNGEERENDLSYPPLWGEHSFNDGAGMHNLHTMASFVYYNMPYHEPRMSMQDALDVAAYITNQPRPHYPKEQTTHD